MKEGRKEDFSFRELTNGLVLIVNDRNLLPMKKVFRHEVDDNAILACGYIDHTAGITFEALCLAEYEPNGHITLRKGNDTTSMKLRYDGIDGIILLFDDEILPTYQKKIDMVRDGYQVNKAILKARNTVAIDDFRHPQFPDDVLLIFYQRGVQPEGIWCRIESELEGRPAAMLMNEPNSNFGVHKGDIVLFDWAKQDEKMIGIAKLPWMQGM